MVRFAFKLFGRRKANAVNEAGGPAFAKSPERELVDLLLTSMLQGGYYRTATVEHKRLCELVTQVDPRFAAQAAVYARHVFGMRTASHVVAGELSRVVSGQPWLRHFYNCVVRRPDDMREIVAYLLPDGLRSASRAQRAGRSLPSALKKGFAAAFQRFDAWQLGAARGEGSVVSLVDIARLVHPRPTEALSSLIAGTLRSQKQDTALTRAGQTAEDAQHKAQLKAEAWAEALPRMGYNALVLSLRSLLQAAPELAGDVAARLVDTTALRRSLILPLQLWQAYLALEEAKLPESGLVMSALSRAMDEACANVPELPGRTLVVYDCSGSMGGARVAKGPFQGRTCIQVAALFTAVLAKALKGDVMRFAGDAEYVPCNTGDSVLTLAAKLAHAPGGSTNFDAPFNRATRAYDRIFILSDMQGWVGAHTPDKAFGAYRQRAGRPACRLYTFDLAGYGTAQFPAPGVTALSGLNFAVFDLLKLAETDRNALLREIEAVEFTAAWVAQQKARTA